MIDYDVPFYGNTPDDTHCVQAALKMIVKYFLPDRDYTWEELDAITAKVEGMWTWPYAALVWLQDQGFEVRNIELMDNQRFADEGKPYLVEFFGQERADANEKHSDLAREQANAKEFIEKVQTEARIPTINDMRDLLQDGYLLNCIVNARILAGREGYAGHSVVVKGIDVDSLILHDPGLPASPNRKVTFETFEKAWSYPTETSRNIIAIKKR